MGLGILGRGVNVAKFLAECAADLIITDLKKEEELKPSLKQLKKFENIKYTLGRHEFADFKNRDFIIKAGGVPFDSLYIAEAKKNKIPIEMDESLFAKLAERVVIVGITGAKGKSITTCLIYEILKANEKNFADKRHIYLGGNVKGQATLPLLKKTNPGDIVVMELDSWRLQGFYDAKISPHISVFTNFMEDHMNYYKGDIKRYFEDKANIFKYQTQDDFLILGESFVKDIKKTGLFNSFSDFKKEVQSKIILTKEKDIPKNWKIKILGGHNLENIAAAVAALRLLKVKEPIIKKTIENFKGMPGRLEFIKEIKGIKFYNDTTATTPNAAIAALDAFKNYKGKIILIGGGADKELDFKQYVKTVKKYVKALILFKGEASDKIVRGLEIEKRDPAGKKAKIKIFNEVLSMREAFKLATSCAERGDIILLSPGAASFGVFKNEFDRGEQFDKLARKLK